jgi:hypothetical protein
MTEHELFLQSPNNIWMKVALALMVTLIIGAYGYAWSIDVQTVKKDALAQVLARLDRIERILLESK